MFSLKVFVSLLLICLASNARSQSATASANAFATIVTPMTIAKNQDLNFGNLDVQAIHGGIVILSPEGTRSASNGVSLPSSSGIVTAADFTVMGSSAATFSIELPANVILTHSNGTQNMTASSFTSTPSSTGVLTGGSQHIKIGATLTVGAGQLPGVYSSQPFEVTVNYN